MRADIVPGASSRTTSCPITRRSYLAKPGLREAWDRGDHSSFHGWDRRAELDDEV
jgi:hypothetical protein